MMIPSSSSIHDFIIKCTDGDDAMKKFIFIIYYNNNNKKKLLIKNNKKRVPIITSFSFTPYMN